jgi:hypothetical protein
MDRKKSTALLGAVVMIAAVAQLVPMAAAFHPPLLERLYGIRLPDESTLLLLRHRAVLLGLVGLGLLAGLVSRPILPGAIALGLASKLSYLLLVAGAHAPTPELGRVARVDLVTAPLLCLGALLWLRAARSSSRERHRS